MLFNKVFIEIEENDLQMLLNNAVREGREIEYKEALSIHTDEQKQEFLNDVSSFANAAGGYLIYGIKESKEDAGIPVEVCGLKGENPGKKIVDIENIIRTGLEPRLYGISIVPVLLPSHEGRVAIALHIPKSYASPHMVKSSGRFYSRNSVGKFPLDVTQLRSVFELAGTVAERIRSFRIERLSRISSGEETPVSLDEQAPKLILHIIPFNAFSTSLHLDLRLLYDSLKGELLKPPIVWDLEPDRDMRFNIDGIVRSMKWRIPFSTAAYTQVFRNGIIEAVDMTILGVYDEAKRFNGEIYEKRLLEAIKRYRNLQVFLGIDPPFFIMVSFLGMKGYRITHQKFDGTIQKASNEIDRRNLILPEIVVENFESDVAEAMKPIFDAVWNAAGDISSPNYDPLGKFIL